METKQIYLRKLWDEKAVIITSDPITLKSNSHSYIYINNRNLICLPENSKLLIDVFMEEFKKVTKGDFAICNVHSSVSPFLVSALSIHKNIPFYLFRPDGFEKGIAPSHYCISFSEKERRDIISKLFRYDWNQSYSYTKNLPAIIIDDVVTTSDTINDAATQLKNSGIKVIGAVALVDRRNNSHKKKSSIELYSALTLREVIQHILTDPSTKNDKILLETELEMLEQ